MRKNGSLNYILGDHLGSTSLITDASGVVINQTQYKAWGEERYSSGAKQTNYSYTGQYSYAADFGLQFYNARWYDSSLGRFTSADTIVPGGSQGYDRYAYTNNNPVKYIDPSGHFTCSKDKNSDDYCPVGNPSPVGGGGNRDDDTDTDTNDNGIPDMPDPTFAIPHPDHPCQYKSLIECTYDGGYWPSGDYTFSDDEWAMFEKALYLDIHRRSQEGFWTSEFDPTGRFRKTLRFLPFHTQAYYVREGYDTIFWNGNEDPEGEHYTGNVCLESGDCYDRNNVNYIAQGMWSAASSEGYHGAIAAANLWKISKYFHLASADADHWAIQGVSVYVVNGFNDAIDQ